MTYENHIYPIRYIFGIRLFGGSASTGRTIIPDTVTNTGTRAGIIACTGPLPHTCSCIGPRIDATSRSDNAVVTAARARRLDRMAVGGWRLDLSGG